MNGSDRDALIVQNLPLVGYLVSDLCARASHLSRDDFASVGAIALITAADAFDPSLGVPFGAYARRRITGAFADEMRSSDWAPRTTRRRIKDTLAVQETLTGTLRRNPTLEEIAATLGVDRDTADRALQDASRTVVSLDQDAADTLRSDTSSPEAVLLAAEQSRYLRAAVTALPAKMRHVVEQVFFHGRTVGSIAEELGTTHSAVSQQRTAALKLLHDGLRTHYADIDDHALPGTAVRTATVSATRHSAYLSAFRATESHTRPHAADRWDRTKQLAPAS
jgi:RNA polymerase sigma factor for flagellar operon FliA